MKTTPAPPSAATVYLSKWPETSDTYKTMRAALATIATALGAPADAEVEAFAWGTLTYERLRPLPALLAEAELAPRTINKLLSALRGVLEAAWHLGQVPDDEYRRLSIDNVRGHGLPAGRALEPAELDAVHAALAKVDRPTAALMAVLAGGGLRRVEVTRIRRRDYDPKTGRLVARGKGNKKRSIPLGQRWREAFEAWWQGHGAEPPGQLLFPINRRRVSYVVEKFSLQVGGERFTPHDLRRTFITHVCRVSDIAVAQRLAGHENVQTTVLYDRRGESAEDEAVRDL